MIRVESGLSSCLSADMLGMASSSRWLMPCSSLAKGVSARFRLQTRLLDDLLVVYSKKEVQRKLSELREPLGGREALTSRRFEGSSWPRRATHGTMPCEQPIGLSIYISGCKS